jgi:hypothetical protein
MVERPLGTVARVDGYDRHGRLVATEVPDFPDFTDFGQSDGCVPFPFP